MDDYGAIMITGGTGKIGLELVRHFLTKGYAVIFTSRKADRIKSLLEKYRNYADRLHGIEVDLEGKGACEKIMDYISTKGLWPHSLINCARNQEYLQTDGILPRRELWLGEFLLDVVVPCELSIALACHKNSKLGNIINIASMYGVVAPNPRLYEDPAKESPISHGVAKAALIHLTKELAIHLVDKGIRVNAISYGGVEGRVSEEFKERYALLCPMGRMLKGCEVVGAADFLISDKSVGMTGHNLVVDGGWSVW